MADSRTGERKLGDKPGASCMPESKEVLKEQKDRIISKRCRGQPERPPDGQCWNTLSCKISDDSME